MAKVTVLGSTATVIRAPPDGIIAEIGVIGELYSLLESSSAANTRTSM